MLIVTELQDVYKINNPAADSFTIADIDVSLDMDAGCGGTGYYWAELQHDGRTIRLIQLCQGLPHDFTLDDETSLHIDGYCGSWASTIGDFMPSKPLSAFDGHDAAGDWTLIISSCSGYYQCDLSSGFVLNGWSLVITDACGDGQCNQGEDCSNCQGKQKTEITLVEKIELVVMRWVCR